MSALDDLAKKLSTGDVVVHSMRVERGGKTVNLKFTDEPDCPICEQTMEGAAFFRQPDQALNYEGLPGDADFVCLDCGMAHLVDGKIVRW